jgi:hypothetical protein
MKSPEIPVKIPALEITGRIGEFQFPAAPIRRWNWKNSPTGKLSRTDRQARIRTRKREYGQRVLTFAEIAKIVSNPRFIDLSHRRFTRLLVVGYAGIGIDVRPNGEKKSYRLWRCKCDCGQFIITRANSLLMGKTRSCSCLRREKAAARFRALHLVERQLGKDALLGMERLSAMTCASNILSNALGLLPEVNGNEPNDARVDLPPVPSRGRRV